MGFIRAVVVSHMTQHKLLNLIVHAYKQMEAECQDFCLCRKFSGRYLCTFHPSFAMDSECCFPSHIIFRELMYRWRQDNNVSFYYWTMKYFSLEHNHSTKGRRRKNMNLLLPYAPSEWPAVLPAGGHSRLCFWVTKALYAFVICFCAGCSFQSCSGNICLNKRTGKVWNHSSCSLQTGPMGGHGADRPMLGRDRGSSLHLQGCSVSELSNKAWLCRTWGAR